MSNNDGIFLVITPTREGVIEALRMKIGMEKLNIHINGAILNGNASETIPIHALEDTLGLEIFNHPQKVV
ncbi:MAG: hypothetical protein V3V92_01415 [Candidatus Hydrothermarchaeales archaeon]